MLLQLPCSYPGGQRVLLGLDQLQAQVAQIVGGNDDLLQAQMDRVEGTLWQHSVEI